MKHDASNTIGIWSTDYTELTGQGIVTARVVSHVLCDFEHTHQYIFRAGATPVALLKWFVALSRLWLDILFRRVNGLYLVCSRSNGGFVRDALVLLAARTGVPVIVHTHGSDLTSLLTDRALSPLARWLYRPCTLIVPSEHLTIELHPYVASLKVCENFFELDRDSHDETSQRVANPNAAADLSVLWNSNIMASKGFFDVQMAIDELHREGSPIKLVSIGRLLADNEMSYVELEGRFDAIRNAPSLDFRGSVTHSDAVSLLEGADVVTLPSRYSSELQPVAIIEAMCKGKSLVVADNLVFRTIVSDYTAAFVQSGDVEGIKSEFVKLIERKQRDPDGFSKAHDGEARKARQRFSADRFDAEMKAIFFECLS